jgi:ligand-binding sensor domain-containing protein/signal transduction histidine kinase
LPERHINDFLETRKGEIWVATDAGLAKLNPTGIPNSKDNPLFTVIAPDNPKAKGIQVLFEDESEFVWVGTSDGLYRLHDGSQLREVDLDVTDRNADTLSISSIIKDKHGTIWLATQHGIRRILQNGDIERYTTEDGLPGDKVSVLYEDKGGRMWAGFRPGRGAGLALLVTEPSKSQNIVERHYNSKVGLPADWVTSLLETSDGKFWVATTSGLCEWQGGKDQVCKTYRTKNDLCDREVWWLTEDNDRNLWIGSQCGAKKWTRYGFTSYHDADGMDDPLANSIFENADGVLFVTFNTGNHFSLSRFDDEKFKLIKPNYPSNITYFGWGWKQIVSQDKNGDWWFPSGSGLLRYSRLARFEDLATVTPEKVEFGARDHEIFRIFEDSRGDIWIATVGRANGLWHWDRSANKWLDVSVETGIGDYRIGTAFVEDRAGNLWIGTGSDQDDTGLIRYRDGRFTVFSKADNRLLSGWIRDLLVDRHGRLWIATTAVGLLRLDDVRAEQLDFVSYTPAEGLSSIAVSCVTEDAFGRIYVGTGRGLDRLNPDTGQTENFTTADGLPNSNVDVAYRDRNNTLWFATANGLARFVPEPQRERRAPNIFITAVRVGGEPLAISILGETSIPALELGASQRQITVDFLGLGSSLGEKLKYEYRLNDSEWTATSERTLNFANLDSASYRFEVRAITADRIYSQPAHLAFRVAAPIWQRWWFVMAIVILAVFLVYALYRYRLGQLVEVERIRTRIATDLHDDIGSNLTRIALLSEVANQQKSAKKELTSSIAEIARESVASMNDIVWAISPDHDSLLDLTRRMRRHAEEVFAFRDINLDFQAPTPDSELKLSVGIRRDLLLIFKEAVSNAAKHSSCTKVDVEFLCEDSVLKLRVKDNGIGFEPDSENDGNGLGSMRRRATALGGRFLIESADQGGTLVEFEARLPKGGRN